MQYPLYRRLGRPQGQFGWLRKISHPTGFDARDIQPVAGYYTIYTILAHNFIMTPSYICVVPRYLNFQVSQIILFITFITHVSWDRRCFHHKFFLTHLCRVGGHVCWVPSQISEIESWESSFASFLLVNQNPFLVHSALNLQLADLCFCLILLLGVFDKQSQRPWLASLIMSVCLSSWLSTGNSWTPTSELFMKLYAGDFY
jgi:hypothetical protein